MRWAAAESGLADLDLGKQGKRGILANRRTRAAFVRDPGPRIACPDTPVHSSWLNQIARWLSILARKVLQRGSFASVADVRERV